MEPELIGTTIAIGLIVTYVVSVLFISLTVAIRMAYMLSLRFRTWVDCEGK